MKLTPKRQLRHSVSSTLARHTKPDEGFPCLLHLDLLSIPTIGPGPHDTRRGLVRMLSEQAQCAVKLLDDVGKGQRGADVATTPMLGRGGRVAPPMCGESSTDDATC